MYTTLANTWQTTLFEVKDGYFNSIKSEVHTNFTQKEWYRLTFTLNRVKLTPLWQESEIFHSFTLRGYPIISKKSCCVQCFFSFLLSSSKPSLFARRPDYIHLTTHTSFSRCSHITDPLLPQPFFSHSTYSSHNVILQQFREMCERVPLMVISYCFALFLYECVY